VQTSVGLILHTPGKQTITITDTLNSLLTAGIVENVM
jgi:hypothetical protein